MMQRSLLVLVGAMLGAALACAERDEGCDPETEIEVLYGNDIGPSTTRCEPAPEPCGDAPDCECLEGQTLANGLHLDFCLEAGECDEDRDVVYVVCPGG